MVTPCVLFLPRYTFLLVAVQLESCENPKCLSILEKIALYMVLEHYCTRSRHWSSGMCTKKMLY